MTEKENKIFLARLRRLRDGKGSAAAAEQVLRFDLAEMITKGMERKGWTTSDLLKAVGRDTGAGQGVLIGIMHRTHSYSLGTVAMILWVLDIVPRLGADHLGGRT